MKQQVEVWQRGSVNFKQVCHEEPRVYPHTEPRCLATEGNPHVSHQDYDHCVTSRQVVPLSGMHSAPVIISVMSVTLSCEIQIVVSHLDTVTGEKVFHYRWSCRMRGTSSHRNDWNTCYTGWKTPGAQCVVRAGFTAGYSSSGEKFPSSCVDFRTILV